jgi:lipopolysaccharide/colanic/teichoic acid biosynthesis glycosyltransferase
MDKIKTGNLIKTLKDVFVKEERITLKNQTPRLVKIKAMRKTKPEVSQEKYQETPF